MSYQVYTTEAFVCGSTPSNTADKHFLLFTRDAGMVYATARSVREERSRQRYALQDFSHVQVSLIKGKAGWRIGSVEAFTNQFMNTSSRAVRGSILKLVRTLRRFVHGEEPHHMLYDEVKEQIAVLSDVTLPERSYAELLARVRIMHHLGYIAAPSEYTGMVQTETFTRALAQSTPALKPALERMLAHVDDVSHL